MLDRTKTVGGSDVAAILGLSPWRTPLDVWREKALGVRDERDTPAMRAGLRMETSILGAWKRQHPGHELQVAPGPTIAGWRHASPDALATNADGWQTLLVVLTSSKAWNGTIPDYDRVQAQWSLDVLDLEEGEFLVLTWPEDMRAIVGLTPREIVEHLGVEAVPFRHDAELGRRLFAQVEAWWRQYVVTMTPPPATDLADARRNAYAVEGKTMPATDAIVGLLSQREQLKEQIDGLDQQVETVELQIRNTLGDAEHAIGFLTGKPIVSSKVVTRTGDTTSVKPTSYRSLTVAKNWRDL
jgi:putative phage-type endonuclease